MQYFKWPLFFSLLGLIVVYFWGGIAAVIIALMLSVMEISLSFDNAILNASILKEMNKKWQRRFLTWGILIAVFGMRLLFPILIVAIIANANFVDVMLMAFNHPQQYSEYLRISNVSISAFGGMFLLMVFLSFLFNQNQENHWLVFLERKLKTIGKMESIEIIMALITLLIAIGFLSEEKKLSALIAGIMGIILFTVLHSLSEILGKSAGTLKRHGAISFLYLEVLDASFSFDGVIAAFAITKDVVIILVGLAIGALFVRTLTLFLVHKRTLQRFIYLEHGAHYAIGALAVIMLMSMTVHIPEIIIGLIGLVFIVFAIISSILRKNI